MPELANAGGKRSVVLALFDLDGFKQYNDTFGHPAGDALLARLGERLATAVDGIGNAYRMGGDEFCVLAPVEPARAETVVALAAAGADRVPGTRSPSAVRTAWRSCPSEAFSPVDALRIADQRMYEQKSTPLRGEPSEHRCPAQGSQRAPHWAAHPPQQRGRTGRADRRAARCRRA